MKIKVKNVEGSSRFDAPQGCDSWLDYWSKEKGRNPRYCAVDNGHNPELVGGHVQKVNSTDAKWYIVPLCVGCNQRTDVFEIEEDLLAPVPSNQ